MIKKILLLFIFLIIFTSIFYLFINNQNILNKLNKIEKECEQLIKDMKKNETLRSYQKEKEKNPQSINPNNSYKPGWQLYKDSEQKFQFFYPSTYQLSTIKNRYEIKNGWILNQKIVFTINTHSEVESYVNCRGDCPLVNNYDKKLIINNYSAKKIKGMVGAVGGNIPYSYITYEIEFPNKEKYFFITLHSIPIYYLSYQELLERYGPLGDTNINPEEEKIFEEIVSTFKIIE